MEQGQPGRRPPGHEPRATRRFRRDAVVFEDYATYEGMVIPQGAIRARYCPETCPELPQKLARLSRGDTAAALAFVRTYGLLGYAQLAAAVGRSNHSHAPGDPLAWIWAHAETVALCLLLTYGLQTGDDATLQHGLHAMQLPQPPHADGGPRLIVPAVWDQPRVHVCWPSPLHSPEDWRAGGRAVPARLSRLCPLWRAMARRGSRCLAGSVLLSASSGLSLPVPMWGATAGDACASVMPVPTKGKTDADRLM